MVLDENGGEVTVGVLGEVAVLDRYDGVVQGGDFDGTGTGAGGDRDLWGESGCGGGFAVAEGLCGFGATGQGSGWDFKG